MTEMTPERAAAMTDEDVLALGDEELRAYAKVGGDMTVVFATRGIVPAEPRGALDSETSDES